MRVRVTVNRLLRFEVKTQNSSFKTVWIFRFLSQIFKRVSDFEILDPFVRVTL